MKNMIYDMAAWQKDRSFSALPGQQVSEEVYDEFFNCLPPLRLSEEAAGKAEELGLYVSAGFMSGEPYDHDGQGALYTAFGRNSKGCFYLGTAHA